MWVLLGSYELEEEFGGYQLHEDIFLGVFDDDQKAGFARDRLFGVGYSNFAIIKAEVNRLVANTGVDWHN